MEDAVYRPQVFDVKDLEAARQIILTDEGEGSEIRWQHETPVVAGELTRELGLNGDSFVLDFGTGIGRLASALIRMHPGLSVAGVDISLSMIQLGPGYVRSQRYFAMHPSALDRLLAAGTRFDAAFAVWVIQHVADPQLELQRIRSALKPGTRFYLLINLARCVPTDKGWANDGIDVVSLLRSTFTSVTMGKVPDNLLSPEKTAAVFCATCVA